MDEHGAHRRPGDVQGTWLKVLAVVAAAAVVGAIWLFFAWGGDDEDRFAPWPDPESTEAATSASPTESAETAESPEESESSPEVSSDAAATDAPPQETAASEETSSTGPSCTATVEESASWPGAIEFHVLVVNSGSGSISGWEVDVAIDGEVYHYWNVEAASGSRYRNLDWNGELAPGQSAQAGFQAHVDDGTALPATVPCTVR